MTGCWRDPQPLAAVSTQRRVDRSSMRFRTTAGAVATVVALTVSTGLVPATAAPARVQRTAYQNPVSRGFADTFADPSVIRGKDGFWYSYGTSDPLREGEGTPHRIPIARSSNLVNWEHV